MFSVFFIYILLPSLVSVMLFSLNVEAMQAYAGVGFENKDLSYF